MAVYEVNDIVRIRSVGQTNGEEFENISHFRIKSTVTAISQLRTDVVEQFLKVFRPFMTSEARYIHINHKKVRPEPVTDEFQEIIDPVVGTISGVAMPHQMAVLVKLKTALDARAGKGRIYIPGWPCDAFSAGLYSVAFRSVLLNQMNSLLTRVGVGGSATFIELGVVSHQAGEGDDLVYNGVTGVQYSLYPAVMRSRRPHIT